MQGPLIIAENKHYVAAQYSWQPNFMLQYCTARIGITTSTIYNH
jgi:hypothetical protein